MNGKIRWAQLMKVPYMLVVGARESADSSVSVRTREGIREEGVAVDTFIERLLLK